MKETELEEGTVENSIPRKAASFKSRSTRFSDLGRRRSSIYVTESLPNNGREKMYDWKEYVPSGGVFRFLHWLVVGTSDHSKLSDEEVHENLMSLARLLSLLREYESRFGMPEGGGPSDQAYVLTELCSRLCGAGAPTWALVPVMTKAAEGLTGARNVKFLMLPRSAFISSKGMTTMFNVQPGIKISMLDEMEQVVVRLASFASNTSSVSSLPSRFARLDELRQAARGQSVYLDQNLEQTELVEEILTLAADGAGLFYFLRRKEDRIGTEHDLNGSNGSKHPADDFWKVEDSIRELFSRLATIEADASIDKIDAEAKELYPKWAIVLFRMVSSAGACGFWFNGSWLDMIVAGFLAVVIAWVGTTRLMQYERVVFEVVASFIVGFIAGLIALRWPNDMCYAAMALGGVLDILQGFKVVYAVVEVMSRQTVVGGANLLEGILFTALIAAFLKFGQYLALSVKGNPDETEFPVCTNGVDQVWYFLLVPLASVSWSGLFKPYYADLPMMGLHGCLAYGVSYSISLGTNNLVLNNFVSALAVTASASIVSRFTGREAVGNTIAGLFVLVPGAYMVNEIFSSDSEGFLTSVIMRAITIGVGSWTGTILCSPTHLGTNRGLLLQSSSSHGSTRSVARKKQVVGPMLFF